MTFAGIDMRSVGESPRHNDVAPSFLAIFCSPSSVDVNVFWRDASTAQSAAASMLDDDGRARFNAVNVELDEEAALGAAIQNCELLFTQKTSRQHAVTPRFCGRLANLELGLDDGSV